MRVSLSLSRCNTLYVDLSLVCELYVCLSVCLSVCRRFDCSFFAFQLDQRRLGFSMRVERADADTVRLRLQELRRRAEGDSGSIVAPTASALEEYEERLAREAAETTAM